ncbi:head-tail connector protein [Streptococcus agalactiae]|uniref:head-tail connector protein n=1 Tax=Streptococcus agalactiae TaxID=1311 RepID=UPI00195A642D|nr:head-tail connector protein [Streptococcus agalactiae]VTY18600.1 Phage gp6-like head-tail connector protein [Streptococcus agalactiae]
MLTLLEAKIYLRVDTSEEDDLIKVLIATSEELCKDVLRTDELEDTPLIRSAMLYAVAYLFEHREEAKHHDLKETLYHLLGGLRKEVF